LTQIITIAHGVLVVAPVVLGLRFGVRVTVLLYAFEVILLVAMSVAILARGGHTGLSGAPFKWPVGSTDVLLTFSLAVLAFGGFEAAAPLASRPRIPGAACRSRSLCWPSR
jgi:amino acid transporter